MGRPEDCESKDELSELGQIPQIQNQRVPRGRLRRHRNANHLLNFVSSSPPATYDHRFHQTAKSRLPSYDPKKFLQANFRFLVSDAIDAKIYESNADLMLDWDDVAQVLYTTQTAICCPITLVPPLCPTITPCGHIFSLEAIIAHMINQGGSELRTASACPLCTSTIAARELRPVVVRIVPRIDRGDIVTFRLVQRQKNSIILQAANRTPQLDMYSSKNGGDNAIYGTDCPDEGGFLDNGDDPFAKFVLTSDPSDIWKHEIQVLSAALVQVRSEGGEEVCYELPPLLAAIESVASRAKFWTARRIRTLQERDTSTDLAQEDVLRNAEESGQEMYQRMQEASERAILAAEGVIEQRKTLQTLDEEFPRLLSLQKVATEESEKALSMREEVSSSNKSLPASRTPIGEKFALTYDENKMCFYQAADGQLIFVGPLNLRMLLEFSKSSKKLPLEFTARILEIEDIQQTEAVRKRYRRTAHLPLGAHFSLCEVDMSTLLPPKAIEPFKKEIVVRARRRAAAEMRQKRKETSFNVGLQSCIQADGTGEEDAINSAVKSSNLEGQYDLAGGLEYDDTSSDGANMVTHDHKTPSFAHIARMGFAATGPSLVGTGASQPSVTGNSVWGKKTDDVQISAYATEETEKSNVVPVFEKRAGASRKSKSRVLFSSSSQRKY